MLLTTLTPTMTMQTLISEWHLHQIFFPFRTHGHGQSHDTFQNDISSRNTHFGTKIYKLHDRNGYMYFRHGHTQPQILQQHMLWFDPKYEIMKTRQKNEKKCSAAYDLCKIKYKRQNFTVNNEVCGYVLYCMSGCIKPSWISETFNTTAKQMEHTTASDDITSIPKEWILWKGIW